MKYIKWLPFLLLLVSVLHMCYYVYFQDSVFSTPKIIGVVLMAIVSILFFMDNHKAEFMLLLALLLGTLNIATFTHQFYFFNIGKYFTVDYFCLLFMIFHFVFSKKEIIKVVDELRED